MKFYIPFGDWSNDGHGKCKKVLVEAPSMEGLLEAERKLEEKYGSNFFGSDFANEYEESYLGENIIEALKDANYPNIDQLNVDQFNEGEEYNSIDNVIDCFIFLLNAYGANITCLTDTDIPEINNWTCPGFKDVGYGCFD